MSQHLPTMPASLVGCYVVIQINARAMVAEYADSPILALAKALGTQKYVALVEKEVRVASCSDEPVWRVYSVSFVGRHPRLRPDMSGSATPIPGRCLPIYPATPSSHETASAPVRPSQPFPKRDCCHRPGVETYIRVYRQPQHAQSIWTLSREHMTRVAAMRGSAGKPDALCEVLPYTVPEAQRASVRSEDSDATIRQPIALSPHRNETFPFVRNGAGPGRDKRLPLLPPPSPVGVSFSGRIASPSTNPLRVFTPNSHTTSTSAAETSVSEIFDRADMRKRHDTMDSGSVYSSNTTSTSTSVMVLPETSSELEYGADLDIIPLVDISFDISELTAIPNPAEFLEERNVVVQLVRKAETRERNTPTPSVRTADTRSIDSRQQSLARWNSTQSHSQRTLSSRAVSPPTSRAISPLAAPPLPPISAGPAKLRKTRSSASYKQISSSVRAVHSPGVSPCKSSDGSRSEFGKGRERRKVRMLVEWFSAFADKPVFLFKRPARAVGRWVRYAVLKDRGGGKAKEDQASCEL